MDNAVRSLFARVGELQLERLRLRWEQAARDELERNRRELADAQRRLAVALGTAHTRAAA